MNDPGLETGSGVDAWIPFPSLRSAGNDKKRTRPIVIIFLRAATPPT
jgi:hypothetical protein